MIAQRPAVDCTEMANVSSGILMSKESTAIAFSTRQNCPRLAGRYRRNRHLTASDGSLPDSFAVAPELLQRVALAQFRMKNVQHHVGIIHHDPAAPRMFHRVVGGGSR